MLSYCLLILQLNFSSYDLLDSTKSEAQLVKDLKDAYRTYRINDLIDECKQDINLAFLPGVDISLKETLQRNITYCDAVSLIPIYDLTLRAHINAYVQSAKRNFEIMKEKGPESKELESDLAIFEDNTGKYYDYLHERFDKLVTISEKEYWKTINKKNYAKAKDYANCIKDEQDDVDKSIATLRQLTSKAVNFQEKSIYQIAIADNYIKHDDLLRLTNKNIQPYDSAISVYKGIIDQKVYCMYLYEAWVKWRCIVQRTKGFSHSSEIPNYLYNKVREEIAQTTLDYISKNEKDEMAIDLYFVIATHGIIKRFGQYQYGNQNSVEFYQLFGTKK